MIDFGLTDEQYKWLWDEIAKIKLEDIVPATIEEVEAIEEEYQKSKDIEKLLADMAHNGD